MILTNVEKTREKYKGLYIEKQRENAKIQYRNRILQGKCGMCGKRPILTNRSYCYICRQKAHNKYLQKKYE